MQRARRRPERQAVKSMWPMLRALVPQAGILDLKVLLQGIFSKYPAKDVRRACEPG